MFRCCSLETSHPRLLPQNPKVCSVHLQHGIINCFAVHYISMIYFITGSLYLLTPSTYFSLFYTPPLAATVYCFLYLWARFAVFFFLIYQPKQHITTYWGPKQIWEMNCLLLSQNLKSSAKLWTSLLLSLNFFWSCSYFI